MNILTKEDIRILSDCDDIILTENKTKNKILLDNWNYTNECIEHILELDNEGNTLELLLEDLEGFNYRIEIYDEIENERIGV